MHASHETTWLQLVEMWLRLSPPMSAIYDAISDLMDSCVKELRKSNKIDTSELTLEQGLFKSFDDIVRRQLDSVWNTVSPKTKQVGPACRLPASDASSHRTALFHLITTTPSHLNAFKSKLGVCGASLCSPRRLLVCNLIGT